MTHFAGDGFSVSRTREHQKGLERFVHISILTAGSVTIQQQGRQVRARQGDAVAMLPGEPYVMHVEDGSEVLTLYVSRDYMESKGINTNLMSGVCWDSMGASTPLFALALWSIAIPAGNAGEYKGSVERSLLELMRGLVSTFLERIGDTEPEQIQARAKVMNIIGSSFADPELCSQTIAELTGISRRGLYRLFSGSGASVAQLIRDKRIEHAKELLDRRTELTVSEIATASGFNGSTQFSRVFKDRFGLPPGEFRDRKKFRVTREPEHAAYGYRNSQNKPNKQMTIEAIALKSENFPCSEFLELKSKENSIQFESDIELSAMVANDRRSIDNRFAHKPWREALALRGYWQHDQVVVARHCGGGTGLAQNNRKLMPAFDNFVQISFVRAGTATSVQGPLTMDSRAGSVVAFLLDRPVESVANEGGDLINCYLSRSYLEARGINTVLMSGKTLPDDDLSRVVGSLVDWAFERNIAGDLSKNRFIENSLLELLVIFAEKMMAKSSSIENQSFALRRTVLEIIESEHVDHQLSISTISRRLGLSTRRIYRLFENEKSSLAQLVRDRRVGHAEDLLRHNQIMTIDQIAQASGFLGGDQLGRAFRAKHGSSPSGYRNSMRGN